MKAWMLIFLTSCGARMSYYDYLDSQITTYETLGDRRPELMERIEQCTGKDYSYVKIGWGADTIHGKVVTLGEKVFVPERELEKEILLHELKHVDQQEADPFFIGNYFLRQTLGFLEDLVRKGRFDGHRETYYEDEALDFAAEHIGCVNQ